MTKWERFFDQKIKLISKNKIILDIGGGFRFQKGLKQYRDIFKWSDYKTLDVAVEFKPDIVGDIHHLPQKDGSVDAIICKAVLEHVYDPIKAVGEMYRILKKDGKCLVYVPFLYPYHGQKKRLQGLLSLHLRRNCLFVFQI